MAKQKVTVSLDSDLWRRVQAVCKLNRTYPSDVLGECLQSWLEQHEAEALASIGAHSAATTKRGQ
jgi:hypothetical protein